MAEEFVHNGYGFYAVDLRKYGRSLMSGQRMFQVRDLSEYFSDIDAAVGIMEDCGVSEIVLLGHSTGGLTASLYMSYHPSSSIKALILNSPFLDWNLPFFVKKVLIPFVSLIGKRFPNVKIYQKPDKGYAETLSASYGGEWRYRTDWKPDILPEPDAGWVRAIDKAQRKLRKRKIMVPVLLMHSEDSVRKGDGMDKYFTSDAILDVKAISRYGTRLGEDVTEVSFPGALHDLVLSRQEIRIKVYDTMIAWLKEQNL